MINSVFGLKVNLPGGDYLVIVAKIPETEPNPFEGNGTIKRRFWTERKFYKTESGAKKYIQKRKSEFRNKKYTDLLVTKGLFSLN